MTALAGQLTRLAAPIALGGLGLVGMGLVDTIVVGRLAPDELAHQALGWSLNGPATLGGVAMLLGVQVLAARAFGAGSATWAALVWRRGVVVGLAGGAVLGAAGSILTGPLLAQLGVERELASRAGAVAAVLALSIPLQLAFTASSRFLEAMQRPGPPAVAMWLANLLNLALNLALVPGLGAIGSAWATVLSRLVLALGMALYVLSRTAFPAGTAGASDAVGYGRLLRIGVPAAASAGVEAGAFALLGVIAARAGGPDHVATFAIATGGLVTLAYLAAQGYAAAGVVIASQALGAGDGGRARLAGWLAALLALAALALAAVGCASLAEPVADAFTTDAAVRALLAGAMVVIGLLMITDGLQGVLDSVLRAWGLNWYPTLVRFALFVGVSPPLAVFLAERRGLGVAGVLLALVSVGAVAAAALAARLAAVGDGVRRAASRAEAPSPGA